MDKKTYYSTVACIKKRLKLEYPVYVHRTKMPKDYLGDCNFYKDKKCFVIRIEKRIPYGWALDIFAHEAGHCISFFSKDKKDHGRSWAIAYARVYEMLFEEN